MEESIRNAEKLIEAANSTLARIKFDSSYDDFEYIMGVKRDERKKPDRKPDDQMTENFAAWKLPDLNEILSLEGIRSGTIQVSNDAKIEEINNRIEIYRQELQEKEEREILRAQFEKDESVISRLSRPATKTVSDTNVSQISSRKQQVPVTMTEDLKSKLLKTQEIVDRGIQTARELSETVDQIRTRPLKSDREDLSGSKSSEKLAEKSDSSVPVKKCKRCKAEMRRTTKQKKQKNEENVLVMRVRGRDHNPRPPQTRRLTAQQLPSLSITGGLSYQKIPNVEILPGKPIQPVQRVNTAYQTFTHDDILRDRIEKVVNELKKSDKFFCRENLKSSKNVECFNCGKTIRVCDGVIDSERIDDLLKMCDYNVYDPRIDEFVSRFSMRGDEEVKCTQTETAEEVLKEKLKSPEPAKPAKDPELTPKVVKFEEEMTSSARRLKISDLSNKLARRYAENAAELENDHLNFEYILREVFRKVDESRELFQEAKPVEPENRVELRRSALSVTTPVLLSFTGSGEEEEENEKRPGKITKRSKVSARDIRKKPELKMNSRILTSSHPRKNKLVEEPKPIVKRLARKPEYCPVDPKVVDKSRKEVANRRRAEVRKVKQDPVVELGVRNVTVTAKPAEEARNTESDYESDFEEESLEEEPVVEPPEESSYKYNMRLSTISEVDSEDRKLSDLEKVEDTEKQEEKESSSDEDPERLLQKVNRNLKEVSSKQMLAAKKGEALKEVPQELTEPLKDVLDALKNQLERTEKLADKLAVVGVEESKEEKALPKESPIPELDILEVLRKTASVEEVESDHFCFSEKLRKEVGFFRDGSSSLSPAPVVAEEVKLQTASEDASEEKSYSEGEISEQELLCANGSSPSIGEIINENGSDTSLSEDISVIKFT